MVILNLTLLYYILKLEMTYAGTCMYKIFMNFVVKIPRKSYWFFYYIVLVICNVYKRTKIVLLSLYRVDIINYFNENSQNVGKLFYVILYYVLSNKVLSRHTCTVNSWDSSNSNGSNTTHFSKHLYVFFVFFLSYLQSKTLNTMHF